MKSILACRNASTGANFATKDPASSLPADDSSISARNGCPSEDNTVNLPRPAACAAEDNMTEATAALSVFKPNKINVGALFGCILIGIFMLRVSLPCKKHNYCFTATLFSGIPTYHYLVCGASEPFLLRPFPDASGVLPLRIHDGVPKENSVGSP
ncbi:hypothetical protein [Herminiimonas sp. CN]|uniref:hypothetical protein n=1 Tax=Herminiimonas sp. CN TaxID=1349818 RepID=UPI001EE672F7|nr:hypothetical protein [Herminiimonas sp. CN]